MSPKGWAKMSKEECARVIHMGEAACSHKEAVYIKAGSRSVVTGHANGVEGVDATESWFLCCLEGL